MKQFDKKQVEKEKIITARLLVENERKRLLDFPKKSDFKAWLGNRTYPLKWMKKQFGETLIEKDGLTFPSGSRFNEADCDVCSKEVKSDENVIQLNFEHCYGCGSCINICKQCLIRLRKKLSMRKK